MAEALGMIEARGFAAMVEAAGYVPVALSADDYIELLPARWQAVNAYGIKINYRTYDGQELNPFRQQPSGIKEHNEDFAVVFVDRFIVYRERKLGD